MYKSRNYTPIFILAPVAFLLLFSGCSSQLASKISSPETPSSPGSLWKPSKAEEKKPLPLPAMEVPEEYRNKTNWSLVQLIDVALLTNNRTKITWYQARAAAASVGSARGAYYPDINANFETTRIQQSAVGGRFSFKQTSARPTVDLSWTVFDFGRTAADVDQARQELITANWNHNAEIQQVILEVQQSYYQYLNAKALSQSQEAAVKRARTNLDAAERRHEAGVATIADVLQAKTAVSQAQLFLDTTRGSIQILRGVLAVAIGVPPAMAQSLEVVDELPAQLPLEQTTERVQTLIQQAFANRPDLAAARATVLAAQSNIKKLQREKFPRLTLDVNADRLYYLRPFDTANNYAATFALRIPVFNGFTREYDVLEAKNEADAARASLASLQQQVGLQVWTSYYNLNTATEKNKTAQSLVESAQQSYDVAVGRYQEGVGSILDLLTAQNALEIARVEEVQARTEWLLTVAQLARDTGTLGLSDAQSIIKER